MNLVTETVELQYGLAPWSATAKLCVLRQARLQDVYAAVAAVEMPDDMAGAARIAYQMAIDDAQLLAQIDSVDGTEPPAVSLLAQLIHPDDMSALRIAAESVKKKQRGESEHSPTPEPSK
jgi:hypothetical protein